MLEAAGSSKMPYALPIQSKSKAWVIEREVQLQREARIKKKFFFWGFLLGFLLALLLCNGPKGPFL